LDELECRQPHGAVPKHTGGVIRSVAARQRGQRCHAPPTRHIPHATLHGPANPLLPPPPRRVRPYTALVGSRTESQQQARLAHAAVADQQQLEQKIAAGGAARLPRGWLGVNGAELPLREPTRGVVMPLRDTAHVAVPPRPHPPPWRRQTLPWPRWNANGLPHQGGALPASRPATHVAQEHITTVAAARLTSRSFFAREPVQTARWARSGPNGHRNHANGGTSRIVTQWRSETGEKVNAAQSLQRAPVGAWSLTLTVG